MSTKQPEDASETGKQGFWRIFSQEYKLNKNKGFFRQQKDMALSARQRKFLAEAKSTADNINANGAKKSPRRVESFTDAVARQNLSEQHLSEQLQRFKNAHLALYFAAGALLVYALWLALNTGVLVSIGVLTASVGLGIQGYIYGFRAWQIEHRNLIRLQDAIRIPETYLVL